MEEKKTVGQRIDGWINLLTGYGMQNKDKTKSTNYQHDYYLNEVECRGLFRSEGIAKRIVELPTREMTRKGFTIDGDTDGAIVKFYKELKADVAIRNLLRWAKVYGGAVAVLWIDDGQTLDQPLNENDIKSIEMIRVYQRWRVDRSQYLNNDPTSKNFGLPDFFQISPTTGSSFKVHYSRTLMIDGVELPEDVRQSNNGWGDSVYQATYDFIRRLSTTYGHAEHILQDFVQKIISIENLQEMIAGGQEALIIQRLHIMDMSRSILNTILLDSKEKCESTTTSVAGLSDLLERFSQAVSAVTGIPMSLLMGQAPKGLNATGESEVRFWYDNVSSEQEEILLPPIQRLVRLIMLCKEGPTKGKELDTWAVNFVPLWQMSEKEVVEIHKGQAEADRAYIETGVLEPYEVANARFGGDKYSTETKLEESKEPIAGAQ